MPEAFLQHPNSLVHTNLVIEDDVVDHELFLLQATEQVIL
jgi:hypothetical protein